MKESSDLAQPVFAETLTAILNNGATNLALSIGYQLRLFDVMDSLDEPVAVTEIAEKANVNVRYLKEWLGVMVCAEIVVLSAEETGKELFFLPKAHGDYLTRRSGNSNLGVYMQEIPLLTTCAMESVVNGFVTGKGVEYEKYPTFQRFMAQLANAKHKQVLLNTFLPAVDDGRILAQLEAGIKVCDVGCGEGIAALLMANAFPASEFIGIDLSAYAIEKARKEVIASGLDNIRFIRKDVAGESIVNELPKFDYITAFDAIHDQSRPQIALGNIWRLLKSNGLFSMIDIASASDLSENQDHPMGSFLYTVSLMHCMPVGLVDDGPGLGMMWGRQQAVAMLRQAGFSNVQVSSIPNDPFNLHFQCKKQ
ncbi:class I SAM-dependent methyltransferase [Desulfobacterales bacterium HSG17]|nr:class I SAM-dependent methyltransferase [Desulfobacterales bacterium HSG17]